MPTYQYACTDCGEQLEVVQKFTDDALTVCPACEGSLRKVFSAVGVVFKGSGFYRNDSRATTSSNGSSNGTPSSSSTSDSSSGSTDKSDGGSAAKKDGASTSSTAKSTSSAPAA